MPVGPLYGGSLSAPSAEATLAEGKGVALTAPRAAPSPALAAPSAATRPSAAPASAMRSVGGPLGHPTRSPAAAATGAARRSAQKLGPARAVRVTSRTRLLTCTAP